MDQSSSRLTTRERFMTAPCLSVSPVLLPQFCAPLGNKSSLILAAIENLLTSLLLLDREVVTSGDKRARDQENSSCVSHLHPLTHVVVLKRGNQGEEVSSNLLPLTKPLLTAEPK